MRLLVVNKRLGYSSTTSYTFELCRALRQRGHEVRLCTGGGDFRDHFRAEGIESFLVKFNFFSFRRLIRLLEEFEPDLIHVQNLRSLEMGQKIAERLRRTHIVTVHHVPNEVHIELSHGLLAGAIAVNEAVREALVNAQRMPKDLIRVIRSGVNLDRFIPGEPSLSDTGRFPVVGAIGRLDPVKGFRFLIAAARKVLDRGKEALFVIVGDGLEEPQLRAQVRELKLEKHVTFCPPLPDLAELIRNFDVVVVPTLRGGVGLTAIEAMAMAKPVVGSAVGELIHLVSDGGTGLLVRERDSDAIAEKIVFLLDHPDQARELGRRAREWVEQNFSLTPMVDATEHFYQELLEENASFRPAGSLIS